MILVEDEFLKFAVRVEAHDRLVLEGIASYVRPCQCHLQVAVVGALLCRHLSAEYDAFACVFGSHHNAITWCDVVCGIVFNNFNIRAGSVHLVIASVDPSRSRERVAYEVEAFAEVNGFRASSVECAAEHQCLCLLCCV